MQNSVSTPPFDPQAVAGSTAGALDGFDYVDAIPGLVAHPRPYRVPAGAPILVSGWMIDPDVDAPARAVRVVLDGRWQYEAETGLSRRDVSAGHPRAPERIGFRAVVPTDGVPAGGHGLHAYGLAADGAWYEAGYRPFWLAVTPRRELARIPGRLRLQIDQVLDLMPDGSTFADGGPVVRDHHMLITGFALDRTTGRGVAGAAAFDSAGRYWSAPCDVVRADVRAGFGAADDRLGFEIVVPADALGRGRHELTVTVFDGQGRLFDHATPVTVDVAERLDRFPAFPQRSTREPAVALAVTVLGDRAPCATAAGSEQVALTVPCDATLLFEGWALDHDGRAGSAVFVELSAGEGGPPQRFPAVAGYRRDAAPTALPAPPVDDAWFSTRLDTVHLAPRAYALWVAVFDESRRSYGRRELGTLTVAPATASAPA
jgi:hypothetical protein